MDDMTDHYTGPSQSTSLEKNQAQSHFPWQRLPTETIQNIVELTFLPNDQCNTLLLQQTHYRSSPFTEAPSVPDLNFMKVDLQSRKILGKLMIPWTVVVEIRHYTCPRCRYDLTAKFGNHDPFLQVCTLTNSGLWPYLLNQASIISIDVRCGEKYCGTGADEKPACTAAMVYQPGRGLNVLELSQLIMIRASTWWGRVLDIRCVPRSDKGARRIAKFLGAFSEIVHDVKVRRMTVDNELSSPLPGDLLPARLISMANRMNGMFEHWTQEAPFRKPYLVMCQRILDEESVPIHRIAMIVAQNRTAREAYLLYRWIEQSSHMVQANRLPEYLIYRLYTDCNMFLILHGVSDYLARQLHEPNPSGCPRLSVDGHEAIISCTLVTGIEEWARIRQAQVDEKFRKWKVDDLQYLVHRVAMLQACVRYYTGVLLASFNPIWPKELALHRLYATRKRSCFRGARLAKQLDEECRRGRTRTYLTWLKAQVGHLVSLNELVETLRGDDIMGVMVVERYDDYEIMTFIEATRKLLDEIESLVNEGTVQVEKLRTIDTSGLMIPRKPKIPTVSDFESMLTTFRSLNRAHLFWTGSAP